MANKDDYLDEILKEIENEKNKKHFETDEIIMCFDALFGRKRLLIVRVDENKDEIYNRISEYCANKKIEQILLEAKKMTETSIRGEVEFINNSECYTRKTPYYISGNRQMIIINGTNEEIDFEVIRAFCYMAFMEDYNIKNLPKDKLPYGSSFVFLAEENFPYEKFDKCGRRYYNDEKHILDMRLDKF